jgi:hypothetical protein
MIDDNSDKNQPDDTFILLNNTENWDFISIFIQLTPEHFNPESRYKYDDSEGDVDIEGFFSEMDEVSQYRQKFWAFLRAAISAGDIELTKGSIDEIPKNLEVIETNLPLGRWRIDKNSFLTWHTANREKIRNVLPKWLAYNCDRYEELFDRLNTARSALVFLRRADFWEIGIQETKHFRHRKGLTYLQFLLSHPRKDYPCHELQKMESVYERSANRHFENDPEYVTPPLESIEENAKTMKEDMAELQRKLDEAKNNNSFVDAEFIEKELYETAKFYDRLYDMDGRPRDPGSQDEKARKAVGKALKEAKDAILKDLPYLEPILNMVTSGEKLGYSPPDQPIEVLTSPLKK